MDKKEVRITLRVPSDLYEKLVEAAKINERSVNGQIVFVLRKSVQ